MKAYVRTWGGKAAHRLINFIDDQARPVLAYGFSSRTFCGIDVGYWANDNLLGMEEAKKLGYCKTCKKAMMAGRKTRKR